MVICYSRKFCLELRRHRSSKWRQRSQEPVGKGERGSGSGRVDYLIWCRVLAIQGRLVETPLSVIINDRAGLCRKQRAKLGSCCTLPFAVLALLLHLCFVCNDRRIAACTAARPFVRDGPPTRGQLSRKDGRRARARAQVRPAHVVFAVSQEEDQVRPRAVEVMTVGSLYLIHLLAPTDVTGSFRAKRASAGVCRRSACQ